MYGLIFAIIIWLRVLLFLPIFHISYPKPVMPNICLSKEVTHTDLHVSHKKTFGNVYIKRKNINKINVNLCYVNFDYSWAMQFLGLLITTISYIKWIENNCSCTLCTFKVRNSYHTSTCRQNWTWLLTHHNCRLNIKVEWCTPRNR